MQTQIRDAVVSYLLPLFQAEYPDLKLVFDNGPFDWNNPPPLFCEMEIEFHDGQQVSLALRPRRRVLGCVYFTVRVRRGRGTREVLQILDWFSNTMSFVGLAGVTFDEAKPDGSDKPSGWYMQSVKVGFISDPS